MCDNLQCPPFTEDESDCEFVSDFLSKVLLKLENWNGHRLIHTKHTFCRASYKVCKQLLALRDSINNDFKFSREVSRALEKHPKIWIELEKQLSCITKFTEWTNDGYTIYNMCDICDHPEKHDLGETNVIKLMRLGGHWNGDTHTIDDGFNYNDECYFIYIGTIVSIKQKDICSFKYYFNDGLDVEQFIWEILQEPKDVQENILNIIRSYKE